MTPETCWLWRQLSRCWLFGTIKIDYLKNNLMLVVAYSDDGWSTLLRDPNDGRLWELIYDDSGFHGAGAPSLIHLTLDNAKNKYKFK